MSDDELTSGRIPHSSSDEWLAIGSAIMGGSAFILQTDLKESHFFNPKAWLVYSELKLWADKHSMDCLAFTSEMRKKGLLEQIGGEIPGPYGPCNGAPFITELFTFMPTCANYAYYVEELDRYRKLRLIGTVCRKAAQASYENSADPDAIITELDKEIGEQHSVAGAESETSKAIKRLTERMVTMQLGGAVGIRTGLANIDDTLGGLLRSRMIVLGARPKVGKTALIEQIIQHIIRVLKRAVVVFQRDMSIDDMVARMACRMSGVIYEDFDKGRCNTAQLKRVGQALKLIDPKLLRIYSPVNLTTPEMRAIVRREIKESNACAVFVDVFQRIRSSSGEELIEGLTHSSKDIRDMANDFALPWVVLAHLNKAADITERPHAGQFKYCDQLFSDADTILLQWSEQDPKELDSSLGEMERQHIFLTIDANRGGTVGDLHLYFDRPHMSFYQTKTGDV